MWSIQLLFFLITVCRMFLSFMTLCKYLFLMWLIELISILLQHHISTHSKYFISMLYAFFYVIPQRLNFICRRFGTLCLFHLHRQISIRLWRWNRQSVLKRRHIKCRQQGITQKKAYNVQNTAKVWNQEFHIYFLKCPSFSHTKLCSRYSILLLS